MQNEHESERRGEELEDRLLDFSARVGNVVDALPGTRLGRHIAGQLVRSGTSPAPNYSEACAAESKRDFIRKLGIALKELRESKSWIKLIIKANLLPEKRILDLLDEAKQLCNIIGKSIVTAKRTCPSQNGSPNAIHLHLQRLIRLPNSSPHSTELFCILHLSI